MDVEGLKAALEEHLKHNPDEHAPQGFRDRFDSVVEELKSGDTDFEEAELHAQLEQIRKEAEGAVHAHNADGSEIGDPGIGSDRPADPPRDERPAPEDPDVGDPAIGGTDAGVPPRMADAEPAGGALQRFGFPLLVIVVLLAAAYFFFR